MSDSEKSPRVTWTDTETRTLIRLWERHLQDLRRQKRNRAVYEAIAAALRSHGHQKTRKQVHSKVENLTQQYRRFARQGMGTAAWPFFWEIDSFLGPSQSSSPKITQDSAHDEDAFCDLIVPEVIHATEVPSGPNDNKEVGQLNFDNNYRLQDDVPGKHCTLAGDCTGTKQENSDNQKRCNSNSDSTAQRRNPAHNARSTVSSGSSSEDDHCQEQKRTRNDVLQKLVEEQRAFRYSIEMSLRRQLELQERQLQAQEDSNMLKRELIGCFREFLQQK